MTEAQYQRMIIEYAGWNGWLVHHDRPVKLPSGKYATPIQGDAGFPDLVLARDGVVIVAELKSAKGYPTPEQKKWATAIGAQYRLWRPRDWGEITKELSK